MASVHLEFVPPDRSGITKLLIYEAPTQDGVFTLIETVTSIGTYPDYISEYTTANAASTTDWFAIKWEDSGGAQTDLSAAVMGGVVSVLQQVVDRVRQRDRSLDIGVVTHEAEGVIERYLFGDPYDPTLTATYSQLNGLTYLVLARVYIAQAVQAGDVESATLGLVSMRSSSGSSAKVNIQELVDLANDALGISTSVILQLEDMFSIESSNYFFANLTGVNILEP